MLFFSFSLQSLRKGDVHSNSGFPSKQPLLPVKQFGFSNNYYQDYTNSKYADLFISPPLNPNMYSFEAPVPAYPLDTVIPTYPPPQPQKAEDAGIHFTMGKTATPELENLLTKGPSPPTDFDNMLKIPESDFSSLLALFTNNEPNDRAEDFAIPSTSSGIFDSFPQEIFQESPALPQQPVNTWREGEQWLEGQSPSDRGNQLPATLPTETSPDPTSFWMVPPSSSSSSPSQLTPLLEAFPSLDHDISLPTPSYSPPSNPPHHPTSYSSPPHPAHLPTSSISPPHNTPTSNKNSIDQLDFFEGLLDFDSMVPPTKKFHETPSQSEASSPISHMHISPASTPLPTSPTSPVETKPDIKPSLSSPTPRSPNPPSEKTKPSPLLFGKSEDEILLKVLVPHPEVSSKPITREKLISMPVEEFNRLLDLAGLNDIEVAFMKEWRRRGKNKMAAMVARKRKRDELSDLDVEVEQLRKQKAGLKLKYDRLRSDIVALKERTRAAEDRVYQKYSRQSGVPVSRDSHVIHVDKAGKVLLGLRPSRQMLLVK